MALGELGTDVRYALVRNDHLFNIFTLETFRKFFVGEPAETRTFDRIAISPTDEQGEHSMLHGDSVDFSAVAYRGDEAVSGIGFKWTIAGVEPSGPERPLPNGHFRATRIGTYRATASAGGRTASITVKVLPNEGFHIRRILDRPEESLPERDRQYLQRLRDRGMLKSRETNSRGEYDTAVEAELHRQDMELRETIRARQEARRRAEREGTPSGVAGSAPEHDQDPTDWSAPTGPSRGPAAAPRKVARVSTSESAAPPRTFMRPPEDDGWDGTDWHTADDPGNAVGSPKYSAPDKGAGNGNFTFSAPVVSLPGRGIDVNLALTYNSRLWNKSGTVMKYDSDQGWPAPGWNLGFGKMIYMGSTGGCMLVAPDGTRRSNTGTNNVVGFGTNYTHTYVGKTSDGSLIDYSCTYQSSTSGSTLTGTATLANGTRITFGSSSANLNQIYPTKIADAQGNYILITYVNDQGPRINTVTDTLARVISFVYDPSGRLIRVTGPGFNGTTRRYININYQQLTLDYGFASGLTTDTATDTPDVIKSIHYPGTDLGYWFGDGDSYSSYGMIAKVKSERAMTYTAIPPNAPGTIGEGSVHRTEWYDFPLAKVTTLTDAPVYSNLTEDWDKKDTNVAVTNYSKTTSSGNEIITVTRPDGAIEKQTSDSNGYWFKNEVLSGATVLSSSLTNFAAGAYGTARPTNVYVTDSLGQTTRTEFTYGSNYNQVTAQKEYDYNGTVYRQTKYTYENHAGYIARHIFNLVKSVEVTDATTGKFARTDYQYDNNVVVNGISSHGLVQIDQSDPADEIVMHDHTFDPWTDETLWVEGDFCILWQWNYPECTYEGQEIGQWEDGNFIVYDLCHESCADYEDVQVSAYNEFSIYRGNVTRVTSYADAATPSGGEVHDFEYDIAGNQRTATTNCCEEMSFSYTAATQYSQPESVTKGSPNPASPHRMTQSAVYDFDTGAVKTATDFNGQSTTYTYDAVLRPYLVTGPTGAYTTTDYGDDDFITTTTSHNAASWTVPNEIVSKSYSELNGRGQPVVSGYYVDGTNRNDTAIQYDEMGRRKKVSMPYASSGSPAHWTEYAYDHLGRATQTTAPDGSTSKSFFNEIPRPDSANPSTTHKGQTVRSQDAWGRERWARTDAFGRLVEVVEPNPSGSAMSAPVNVAASANGGTATASSTYYTGQYPVASAINGDRKGLGWGYGTGGWADNTHNSYPDWLQVAFDGTKTIDEISVFTLQDNEANPSDPTTTMTFTQDGIVNFDVQYWNGTAWATVTGGSVAGNNNVWRKFTFAAVTTDKIRVVVNWSQNATYRNSRIVELEAWTAPQSIAASGSVFDPGSLRTEHAYDRLDRLTQITQGAQTRSFKYDALGRLTRQKLAEQTATINDAGTYVGSGGTGALWSDAFSYDGRGNLIRRTDARGVKTNFSYDLPGGGGSDPLNRLHGISYDKTGAASTPLIHEAPDVSVEYETSGDKSRVKKVTAAGVSTEENAYDTYGRVTDYTVTMLARSSYPFVTSYQYDTANRPTEIRYPKQYGMSGDPRRIITPEYDPASRLFELEVNGSDQLSNIVYNPAGQATQMQIGVTSGITSYFENYSYDPQTGLLTDQSVQKSTGSTVTDLLNLSYEYNRGGSIGSQDGKTGQLTRIIDNTPGTNGNRDRVYEHDALGRLIKTRGGAATGITGPTADWTQDYTYDRYGNKTGNAKTGITADSNPVPLDGLPSLSYDTANNRINSIDWEYDLAGNQTRGQNDAGAWLRFEYDEAGRLAKVTDDTGNDFEAYTYGADRKRLINATPTGRRYYAWGGEAVVAEYLETPTALDWAKSYVHAGSRLLSTFTRSGSSEVEEFHHPDRLGTRLVTNPSTNTSFQQSTLPFGTALPAESTGFSDQVFTSYDRSASTGLDYAINRTYSAGQSRFTHADPIGMSAAAIGNPQSNNLFAYVRNMPADYLDPSGLSMEAVICIPILRGDGEGNRWYEWDCQVILVGGGTGWEPDVIDDFEIEIKRRLDLGKCRQKLNDLLKALGQGKLKDKKTGKTGIDALLEHFFAGDRIDQTMTGYSNYNPGTGRITMNVDPNRGAGFGIPLAERLGTEMIHEILHGAKKSSYDHEDIVRAIAKVEGVSFNAIKKERQQEKGKDASDSALYEKPMNDWINKVCGREETK